MIDVSLKGRSYTVGPSSSKNGTTMSSGERENEECEYGEEYGDEEEEENKQASSNGE